MPTVRGHSLTHFATRSKRAIRAAQFAERAARPSRRPVCVVYGNCQAEVLRTLLDECPEFASRYRTVGVPGVHELEERDLRTLRRLLERTELLVTHPVRDGYRGMPVGSDEVAALMPNGARVIKIVPLYFEGLLPYQVYVHRKGEQLSTPAPMTGYHDLRTLYAASRPDPDRTVRDLFAEGAPPDALRKFSSESADRLLARESTVDIHTWAESLAAMASGRERVFYTVNHPTDAALRTVAGAVCGALGIAASDDIASRASAKQDGLAMVQTPIESAVTSALGIGLTAQADWVIERTRFAQQSIVEAHLAWYAANPDALRDGLDEHAARLSRFEFL